MLQKTTQREASEIGIGFYTVPEAARLLKMPSEKIRRWLRGYTYRKNGKAVDLPPLWHPQLPAADAHIELGFRDLIELRAVNSFLDAGLRPVAVRDCQEHARECASDERPFSTQQFQADG